MNRKYRRKEGLTGKQWFPTFPNNNEPKVQTLLLAHKTQERKEFLQACYKQGMTKLQAMAKWASKESLANQVSQK